MATYYAVNAGGNWTAGATWSTTATKDASRTGGSTAPTASDDCIIDDYSGNVTVNANSVCKSLDCNGGGAYVGTLTFTAPFTLTVSGSVTFSTGMTVAGTGNLSIAAAGTLTSAGVDVSIGLLTLAGASAKTLNTDGTTWPSIAILSGAQTITLSSDLQCTTLDLNGNYGNITFAGAYDITCAKLMAGYGGPQTTTIVSGQTLTVTTSLLMGCNYEHITTLKSSTASVAAYLTYQGTVANCAVSGMAFTDIDASGSAQGIDNWYGQTLTRTTGITNRTSADIGGGGGGGGGGLPVLGGSIVR